MAELDGEVEHDFFPFIRQYKSGRVVRLIAPDTVPAGTDTASTGVSSKDVVINPTSGLWARLYLPPLPSGRRQGNNKLPVIVYYQGGAFVIGSTAHRPTHEYLNSLAADADALIVSSEYRLAPEHPLPTAHEDSWEALQWVASHSSGERPEPEPWLVEHGDMSRVFVAGVSAGGNIAHHMAARAGGERGLGGVRISGLLVIHAYFNSESAADPTGVLREKSAAFWRFVCPGTPGLDDPLCNPFSEAAGGSAARVAAGRVLVCVAGKDTLRDRGVWYYESLKVSGYRGEVELHESVGEGHVFHYAKPGCEQARLLRARVLSFLRHE